MLAYEKEMIDVLRALDNSGALSHCIISGSWATYFYNLIFEGFEPLIKTTDLDIYLPNPKKRMAMASTSN